MALSKQKRTANSAPSRPSNRLLSALSASDYGRLAPHVEKLHLEMKHVAFEANQPIEYAYFPLTGVASLVTVMKGGKAVEIATVGNEE
jgi:hypothetical protein